MKRLSTLKDKIQYRIRKSKTNTFLVNDFMDLSGRNQVLRALKKLIRQEEIVRVGKSIYTKVRRSSITGHLVPQDTLREIAIEALIKLGVDVVPTQEEYNYNNRLTEQVPNELIIGVDRPVTRNISFGKMKIITIYKKKT